MDTHSHVATPCSLNGSSSRSRAWTGKRPVVVEVATLREDREEARVAAEAAIRSFVESQTAQGRRVLVLPYRLSGFGPYAAVLEGLDYVAGDGLLPHDAISRWIEQTAAGVACENAWAKSDCDRFTNGRR